MVTLQLKNSFGSVTNEIIIDNNQYLELVADDIEACGEYVDLTNKQSIIDSLIYCSETRNTDISNVYGWFDTPKCIVRVYLEDYKLRFEEE